MKICVNGVSRDMTPEEEAAFVAMREQIAAENEQYNNEEEALNNET